MYLNTSQHWLLRPSCASSRRFASSQRWRRPM